MFQARFSISLARLFRFRRRRGPKPDPSPDPTTVSVAPTPLSAPQAPSEPRRPASLHLESIAAPTPFHPLLVPTFLSPIAQSPTSPDSTDSSESDTDADGAPVIVIGAPDSDPDPEPALPPLPPLPLPLAAAPSDGVLLVDIPALTGCARRVSFQVPSTIPEDPPASPLSTCSTLVSDDAEAVPVEPPAEPRAQVEAGTATATAGAVAEQPHAPSTPDSESIGATPTPTDRVSPFSAPPSKTRHTSFISPQPVRLTTVRFSLPVQPRVPSMTVDENAKDSKRASRWSSLTSPTSTASPTKKEKRSTRWSRELGKPETQEVLRVLRGL